MNGLGPAGVAEHLRAHLALAISAALITLSVLHVLLVARFDTATALALLSVANRTVILTSTLLSVAASASLGVITAVLPDAPRLARRIPTSSFAVTATIAFIVGVLIVAAMQAPRVGLVIPVIGLGIVVLLRPRKTDQGSSSNADATQIGHMLLATCSALLALSILMMPWVPQENIVVGGEKTSGFIYGSDQGRFLIMIDQNAIWVPAERVERRELCSKSNGSWLMAPLVKFTDYSDCSEQRRPPALAGAEPAR